MAVDDFIYYEVHGNSNQTDGYGPMEFRHAFETEAKAVEWADSPGGRRECGVQGVGPGDVWEIRIAESATVDMKLPGELRIRRAKVWGYRKDWNDAWGYGYMDLRDKPDEDPEWGEYVRLKAKFGKAGS